MKQLKNPLILLFAVIGVCALLYGGWRFYEQKVAERQARAILTAPPNPGLPNPLFGTPGAPPPQP